MAIDKGSTAVVPKSDVEVVFQKALLNMLERTACFSRRDDHLRFLYALVTTTAFYKINSRGAIREFFSANFIESQAGKDHAREMLDYLQSMMFEFRLRLRQESATQLRELTSSIAGSYAEWAQPSGSTFNDKSSQELSVLPEDNHIYPAENVNFMMALEQNGWFLALLLIRLYGMPLIYRYQPAEVEPGKPNGR